MKQFANIILGLILLLFTSCDQKQIKNNGNTMTKFEEFKNKEKFTKDDKLFYSGLGNPVLKPALTKILDITTDDFKKLASKGSANDTEYQDAIKNGLDRFTEFYLELDTEDRERICYYFEELMDIVGLESSGGHLNNFMYNFDFNEK